MLTAKRSAGVEPIMPTVLHLFLSCSAHTIKWAKMYVYYRYAHKASWHTIQQTPYISRPIEVYQVSLKSLQAHASLFLNFYQFYVLIKTNFVLGFINNNTRREEVFGVFKTTIVELFQQKTFGIFAYWRKRHCFGFNQIISNSFLWLTITIIGY